MPYTNIADLQHVIGIAKIRLFGFDTSLSAFVTKINAVIKFYKMIMILYLIVYK